MKAKTFGCDSKAWPLVQTFTAMPPYGIFPLWVPVVPITENVWAAACLDYRKNRENGIDEDNPSWVFPEDGRGYWEEVKSIRNKNGHKYWSRAHYDQGRRDQRWMKEKDQNYLARIEREGTLKELEPAVWYLREKEHATNINIKIWWAEKLKLSNLPEILKQAEQKMKEGILGFLEGLHERLGAKSLVKTLPKEIVLQISELTCRKNILVTDFFKQNKVSIAPVSWVDRRPGRLDYLTCSVQ